MCNHFTASVVGIAGGSFDKSSTYSDRSPFCVVSMRGSDICAINLRLIKVDGLDVTSTAIDILRRHTFDFAITQGVSFSGFNVIDLHHLQREFNKPIIAYMSQVPNPNSILQALMKHFPDWRERWALFENLGPVHSTYLQTQKKRIYFEVVGASPETAQLVLRETTQLSGVPEPLRISRLIARGVSLIGS